MLAKALFGQKRADNSHNDISPEFVVRLVEPVPRAPVTPVERLAVARLQREGALDFNRLVERVASDLYDEELRNGASVLDIGLIGSKLFASTVAEDIRKGDGTLWLIEKAAT